MANKSFMTYQPAEEQFISMTAHDGTEHTFKLNPSLPGVVILNFMFVSGTDDSGRLAKAIQSVLDNAIEEGSREAWDAFVKDARNGVTLPVLSEIVGYVTSVLSGNDRAPEA